MQIKTNRKTQLLINTTSWILYFSETLKWVFHQACQTVQAAEAILRKKKSYHVFFSESRNFYNHRHFFWNINRKTPDQSRMAGSAFLLSGIFSPEFSLWHILHHWLEPNLPNCGFGGLSTPQGINTPYKTYHTSFLPRIQQPQSGAVLWIFTFVGAFPEKLAPH